MILQAQRDRVTLTGWFGDRYNDLRAQVSGLAAAPATATPPQARAGGSTLAPLRGWSTAITVPAGYRLCASAEGGFRTQCHPTGKGDGIWHEGSKRCAAVTADRVRFRGTGRARRVTYRFIASGSTCG